MGSKTRGSTQSKDASFDETEPLQASKEQLEQSQKADSKSGISFQRQGSPVSSKHASKVSTKDISEEPSEYYSSPSSMSLLSDLDRAEDTNFDGKTALPNASSENASSDLAQPLYLAEVEAAASVNLEQYSRIFEKCNVLERDRNFIEIRFLGLKEDLETTRTRLREAEQMESKLKRHLKEQGVSLDSATTKLEELEKENHTSKEQLERSSRTLAVFKRENRNITEEAARLESENGELLQAVNRLRKTLYQVKNERDLFACENSDLRKQVEMCESMLECLKREQQWLDEDMKRMEEQRLHLLDGSDGLSFNEEARLSSAWAEYSRYSNVSHAARSIASNYGEPNIWWNNSRNNTQPIDNQELTSAPINETQANTDDKLKSEKVSLPKESQLQEMTFEGKNNASKAVHQGLPEATLQTITSPPATHISTSTSPINKPLNALQASERLSQETEMNRANKPPKLTIPEQTDVQSEYDSPDEMKPGNYLSVQYPQSPRCGSPTESQKNGIPDGWVPPGYKSPSVSSSPFPPESPGCTPIRDDSKTEVTLDHKSTRRASDTQFSPLHSSEVTDERASSSTEQRLEEACRNKSQGSYTEVLSPESVDLHKSSKTLGANLSIFEAPSTEADVTRDEDSVEEVEKQEGNSIDKANDDLSRELDDLLEIYKPRNSRSSIASLAGSVVEKLKSSVWLLRRRQDLEPSSTDRAEPDESPADSADLESQRKHHRLAAQRALEGRHESQPASPVENKHKSNLSTSSSKRNLLMDMIQDTIEKTNFWRGGRSVSTSTMNPSAMNSPAPIIPLFLQHHNTLYQPQDQDGLRRRWKSLVAAPSLPEPVKALEQSYALRSDGSSQISPFTNLSSNDGSVQQEGHIFVDGLKSPRAPLSLSNPPLRAERKKEQVRQKSVSFQTLAYDLPNPATAPNSTKTSIYDVPKVPLPSTTNSTPNFPITGGKKPLPTYFTLVWVFMMLNLLLYSWSQSRKWYEANYRVYDDVISWRAEMVGVEWIDRARWVVERDWAVSGKGMVLA